VTVAGAAVAASDRSGTELRLQAEAPGSTENDQLVVRICRLLQPGGTAPADGTGQPCLSATWRLPDGTQARGTLATARFA